jgi:secreted trypsin-like serine protease
MVAFRFLLRCGVAALCMTAPALAIVGPSSPAPELAPHAVMVLKRSAGRAGFCSAAVVARDAILTAAHCVAGLTDTRAHYRDGSGAPALVEVSAIAVHPEFHAQAIKTRERSIDLALVRLAKPLPRGFEPVSFAQAQSPEGARLTLAGFGVTQPDAPATSGVLRRAALSVRAPASRILMWATGAEGRAGACTGDSGAPVFDDDNRLAAIVAWASNGASGGCGALTQGAWIAPQRDWIAKTLAGWGAR